MYIAAIHLKLKELIMNYEKMYLGFKSHLIRTLKVINEQEEQLKGKKLTGKEENTLRFLRRKKSDVLGNLEYLEILEEEQV